MAEILFNKKGDPLLISAKSYMASTAGAPADKLKQLSAPKPSRIDLDKIMVGNLEIALWGSDNQWPARADQIISKVGVLNTGLRFTRNFTLGQGIFPCVVTGYDKDGNEILVPPKDPMLAVFANSRMIRDKFNAAAKAVRDFDLNGVEVVLIANEQDKNYGIRCTLTISSPQPMGMDPDKWNFI